MAIETEIRLLLDAVALRRVSRLAEVRAARRGRANTRRLRDIYFDTPAADLMGAGAVLRAREERGSWIQTLKWDSRASSGLYERERWEWPIAGPTLNLKALRGTGAARLLAG